MSLSTEGFAYISIYGPKELAKIISENDRWGTFDVEMDYGHIEYKDNDGDFSIEVPKSINDVIKTLCSRFEDNRTIVSLLKEKEEEFTKYLVEKGEVIWRFGSLDYEEPDLEPYIESFEHMPKYDIYNNYEEYSLENFSSRQDMFDAVFAT